MIIWKLKKLQIHGQMLAYYWRNTFTEDFQPGNEGYISLFNTEQSFVKKLLL